MLVRPDWFVAESTALRPAVFDNHPQLLVFARMRGDTWVDVGEDSAVLRPTAQLSELISTLASEAKYFGVLAM